MIATAVRPQWSTTTFFICTLFRLSPRQKRKIRTNVWLKSKLWARIYILRRLQYLFTGLDRTVVYPVEYYKQSKSDCVPL